ncbi:mitochondrial dicarboxylate/tricarboxylate transporter DTC [Tanacetum coccineum]|uniref:Mitochondrial dicarboxylate/tricarboxylate transporter DTC n=1 Tax=Tanacetum coccineum TaxID=301880 RepID=A0ABQ5FR91_9ASTR
MRSSTPPPFDWLPKRVHHHTQRVLQNSGRNKPLNELGIVDQQGVWVNDGIVLLNNASLHPTAIEDAEYKGDKIEYRIISIFAIVFGDEEFPATSVIDKLSRLEKSTSIIIEYYNCFPSEAKMLNQCLTKLMEQLGKSRETIEMLNSEIGKLDGEVELQKTRATNTKEKVNLAVTKGKLLVQQCESLKQVIVEKTNGLSKCLIELQEKSSALEATNSFKEEALLQRDVVFELVILTNKALEANDGKPMPLYEKALCGLTAGAIGAFGAGPTVVRAMAMNIGMLACYDQSVEFFKDNLGFGEAATIVGVYLKKMQPDAEGKLPYTGSLDHAMKTLKAGGPLKFYSGFPVYCVSIAPHVMIDPDEERRILAKEKKASMEIIQIH